MRLLQFRQICKMEIHKIKKKIEDVDRKYLTLVIEFDFEFKNWGSGKKCTRY